MTNLSRKRLADADIAKVGSVMSGDYIPLERNGEPVALTATAVATATVTVDDFASNTTPGTTDMTAAIQAAVDQVDALGGGFVHFLNAEYLISSTIEVNRATTLLGQGWRFQDVFDDDAERSGTWIAAATGMNADLIRFVGDPQAGETDRPRLNCGLRDLGIYGNRSDSWNPTTLDNNTSGSGLQFDGISYSVLENVCAWRCAEEGFSGNSHDYGGSIGSFGNHNFNWNNVVSIGNGGQGFNLFAGDSTFARLVAGGNGGDGIRMSSGPLSGARVWNNFGYGVVLTGNDTASMVGCMVYDNDLAGIRVACDDATIVGCHIYQNGAGSSGDAWDYAGIFIDTGSDNLLISGNEIYNRVRTTQTHAVWTSLTGLNITWGSNHIDGMTTADFSMGDDADMLLHGSLPSTDVVHPGFTASGLIDMAGNRLHNVQMLSLSGWTAITSITAGDFDVGNRSLISANVSGGGTIQTITGNTDGIQFLVIRNTNATSITFEHATGNLRLIGAADITLAQHEAIQFAWVSGTVWQHIGGKL